MKSIQQSGDYIILNTGSEFLHSDPNCSIYFNTKSIVLSIIFPQIKPENYIVPEGAIRTYFSWSRDGQEFSDWQVFDLNKINRLGFICSKLKWWIRFRLEAFDDLEHPVSFSGVQFTFNNNQSTMQYDLPFDVVKNSIVGASGITTPISTTATFDIQKEQEKILQLQKQVSRDGMQLLGFDSLYIRASEKVETKDPFLLEWGLLQYQCPVYLRVIFPDGEIPDPKWNLDKFGINFEIPVVINIDLTYFQSIFGVGSMPQKHDMIYFKWMNRMYEVQSVSTERGIKYEPLRFIVNLVKAEKREYIQPTDQGVENFIKEQIEPHQLTINKLFGEDVQQETIQKTNPLTFNNNIKSPTNKRTLFVNDRDIIFYDKLYIGDIMISNSYYNFSNFVQEHPEAIGNIAIEWLYPDNIDRNNYIYTTFFNMPPEENKWRNVKRMWNEGTDMRCELISLPKQSTLTENNTFFFRDETGNSFYLKLIEFNRFKKEMVFENIEGKLLHGSHIEMSPFNARNFCYSENISIDYLLDGILEVKLSNKSYLFNITETYDKWSCLVVKYIPKLGNSLSVMQLSLPDWTIVDNHKIQIQEEDCNIEDLLLKSEKLSISLSNIKLSNIRVYTKNIPDNEFKDILPNLIQKDSQYLLVDDCALMQDNHTYYGQSK